MCFSCLLQTSFAYRDVIRSSFFSRAYTISNPSWLRNNSFQETEKTSYLYSVVYGFGKSWFCDVVANETKQEVKGWE